MKHTINFTGHISCVEPLTVSIQNATFGASEHRLPRNGSNTSKAHPFFPASSIRGKIRNETHLALLKMSKQANLGENPMDIHDHFMLAQGVDSARRVDASKPGGGVTDAHKELRKANPMLSLFGRWGLASKLSVGIALPEADNCWGMFGGGFRGVMFEKNQDLLQELNTDDAELLERIMIEQVAKAADKAELKSTKQSLLRQVKKAAEDEKEGLFAKVNEIQAQIDLNEKDTGIGPDNTIRRPIDEFEAFTAGAMLKHRMALNGATQAELGLFLLGLQQFARNPRLGGHIAHNCGLIEASWVVTTWPEEEESPVTLGKVALGAEGFLIETSENPYASLLDRAMDTFRESFDQFDFKAVG